MFYAKPRIRRGKNPPTDVAISASRAEAESSAAQMRADGHKARVSERFVSVDGAKVPIFVVSIWAA